MSQKLQYLIIHATATPEGVAVTPDQIKQWHLAPYALTAEDVAKELKKATDPLVISILKSPGVLRYKRKLYRNANDLPDHYLNGESIKKIRGRGWNQVGYSDMIMLDGTLANLVPYNDDAIVDNWEITNGTTGINAIARHIVYAGGTDKSGKAKDTRTTLQKEKMELTIRRQIALTPWVKIAGHNQFANKDCPCFNVPQWCKSIHIPESNIYTK